PRGRPGRWPRSRNRCSARARAVDRTDGRRRRWPRGPRTTPGRSFRGPGSSPGGRSSCTWLAPRVRLAQGFLAERKALLPAVHGLLLTVSRAVVVEEAVARAVVAMELVLLAVLLGLRLVRVDLFGRGRVVLV